MHDLPIHAKIMRTYMYNHRIIPLSLNETALQVCLLNLVFLLFLSNEISECAIKMHATFSSICTF